MGGSKLTVSKRNYDILILGINSILWLDYQFLLIRFFTQQHLPYVFAEIGKVYIPPSPPLYPSPSFLPGCQQIFFFIFSCCFYVSCVSQLALKLSHLHLSPLSGSFPYPLYVAFCLKTTVVSCYVLYLDVLPPSRND